MERLLAQRIATRRVQCIHRAAPYRGAPAGPLVETERAGDSNIVLPLFHGMTEADVDRVVRAVIA